MEDILDAKLNLSYKDYQLTDEDFFMGCPSMLMSEKAALAKVNQLYKKFKAKKRF
jgi:fructose-specific phosphotransferase system component IIB|tara:strand:+ start:343 stop:507 length:165 start_codon:yes stop_codon:yes gene_type:complete